MIVCGEKVRVKEGNPKILPEYYGQEGRIHLRNSRVFKLVGGGEYEIRFFDSSLNHPIMGVMGGFNEDDLEVVS